MVELATVVAGPAACGILVRRVAPPPDLCLPPGVSMFRQVPGQGVGPWMSPSHLFEPHWPLKIPGGRRRQLDKGVRILIPYQPPRLTARDDHDHPSSMWSSSINTIHRHHPWPPFIDIIAIDIIIAITLIHRRGSVITLNRHL